TLHLPFRVPRIRTIRTTSFDHCPGDGGRLAAGEQPARRGGGPRGADDREGEVEDRDVTQVAEVVVVGRHEEDVGAGDAEQRAEERECAGGGARQRAADAGGGSGRGQGGEVPGAIAMTFANEVFPRRTSIVRPASAASARARAI